MKKEGGNRYAKKVLSDYEGTVRIRHAACRLCGGRAGFAGGGEKSEANGLVVGENAFETGIYIKCASSEEAKFFVEPTRDDLRATVEEGWKDGGMSSGNFGTLALVEGKKKGEEASSSIP